MAEVIDISDSDEEAAAAEEEEEAAEAAPEATESLTPQAGRPLVDAAPTRSGCRAYPVLTHGASTQ